MVDLNRVRQECVQHTRFDVGSFYGSAESMSLGAGVIYEGVRYPLLDIDQGLFDTVEGVVLVLTHECDVDEGNNRHFNDYVVCCPIIPLEFFTEDMKSRNLDDDLLRLARDISANKVSRVMYLPPAVPFPYGGFIYLNQICSTHVSMFGETAKKSLALTAVSLRHLDNKLSNHFLRPKAQQLPLTRFMGGA